MQSSRRQLISCLSAHNRKITGDERGIAILEFAFLLPLFALLVCAVLEFGYYFIRYEITTRVVSLTAAAVQNNASTLMQDDNDQATAFAAQLQANATNSAIPIINFSDGNSYVCAVAYATMAEAQANAGCVIQAQTGDDISRFASGAATNAFVPHWYLTNPNAGTVNVSTPYYVAIQAYAEPMSLTGFIKNILPQGTAIFTPNPTIVVVGGGNLPTCAAGQILVSNGSGYTCSTQAPGTWAGYCEQGWGGVPVYGVDNVNNTGVRNSTNLSYSGTEPTATNPTPGTAALTYPSIYNPAVITNCNGATASGLNTYINPDGSVNAAGTAPSTYGAADGNSCNIGCGCESGWTLVLLGTGNFGYFLNSNPTQQVYFFACRHD